LYKQASENLVRESVDIFSRPELRDDFRQNIASILEFTARDFFDRIRSTERILNRLRAGPYLFSMKKAFNSLKGSTLYRQALLKWCCIAVRMIWWLCTKFDIKAGAAQTQRKFERLLHVLLEQNKKGSGA